jgi:hypothetical protein
MILDDRAGVPGSECESIKSCDLYCAQLRDQHIKSKWCAWREKGRKLSRMRQGLEAAEREKEDVHHVLDWRSPAKPHE